MDLRSFRALAGNAEPQISLASNVATGAMSVSQLNEYIRRLFEKDTVLENVCLCGEISNFVAHRSGHFYFSVKDQDSLIRAVMFRTYAQKMTFMPENGMKVILRGSVSVFARDGQYQLYATLIVPDGIGALHIAFEERKRKLAAEGLFEQSRKKPLPKIPSCVGVITSPTGAAVRDIIHVLGRRFPFAKVLLYPALVQGDEAPPRLIAGIRHFNESSEADVIIIGRGGGSMEDLFAFNDEGLAREIAASQIPIISAVGHETDFTICDFVADMRAPTPSAAAELAVPETGELLHRFEMLTDRMRRLLRSVADNKRHKLQGLADRPIFRKPEALLGERQMRVLTDAEHLVMAGRNCLQEQRSLFREITARLHALSPLAVLSRGYCVAFNEQGKSISSVNETQEGALVHFQFTDGMVDGKIERVFHSAKQKEKYSYAKRYKEL